jgi:hypothetical protein
MSPSALKYHVSETGSHHFDRKTMKFFGDSMKNYGVRDAGDAWELYRKHAVKHGLNSSAYFDKQTFAKVIRP